SDCEALTEKSRRSVEVERDRGRDEDAEAENNALANSSGSSSCDAAGAVPSPASYSSSAAAPLWTSLHASVTLPLHTGEKPGEADAVGDAVTDADCDGDPETEPPRWLRSRPLRTVLAERPVEGAAVSSARRCSSCCFLSFSLRAGSESFCRASFSLSERSKLI